MEKIITEKLYCSRCGKSLQPYVYINNLEHAIILNKNHLLSFCNDCIEKNELEKRL